MISEEKVTEVFRTLNNCNIDYANGKICEFTQEQKDHYELLLNDLEREQASKTSSTKDKGAALENLVNYLLQCSGDLFEVYNDVRTNTNEIDQIIKLKVKGRMLRSLGVLDERYDEFICECKNYKNRVGVTYVGKFCSLMNSCNIKFGVLFSYRGVTGSGWKDSSGLIKKIYMKSNVNENPTTIIDFNIEDFKSIRDGNNFLDIIETKIMKLKYDTNFETLIQPHPAENLLKI
ncbi:hypothetical protein [uncultured Ruminococcus sp.]|uniref:hypothetical protein n=1 Tax=uncultured Ruminococcus sp. TaxID=165186 RepID=UPI0026711302|nr:hypothetical protein [uncultured Ruminococcus sp.]